MKKIIVMSMLSVSISGCALTPYDLGGTDQMLGIGPKNSTIIKSLRCEIVTFIVENKLRSTLWAEASKKLKDQREHNNGQFKLITATLKEKLPYIDIDSKQYAALQGDFKNIDTITASLGLDWKYTFTPVTTYKDFHIGPSYTQTRTFESIQPIAIPQNADLGSAKSWVLPNDTVTPKAASFTTLYNKHPPEDEDFYCYSSFYNSTAKSLDDAIADVHKLVIADPATEGLTRFHRVFVDGQTLAKWLQDQTSEMSDSYRTFQDSPEAALPGQLEYSFTLDVKPGMDFKYSLLKTVINPLVPEVSGNIEHSTSFTLYLNTLYALPSLQAKGGNSCVGVTKNGECTAQQIPLAVLDEKPALKRPK